MFRGSFEHTIDGKGRMNVPAKFRDTLKKLRTEGLTEAAADDETEDSVVVTNFVQNEIRCLDVYPLDAWQRVEETLKAMPRMDAETLRLRNFYLGRACECPVDKQGRVLIPLELRKWAGLSRDVVFVSDLDRFQIYDKATWEKYQAITESEISQNPGKLTHLSF